MHRARWSRPLPAISRPWMPTMMGGQFRVMALPRLKPLLHWRFGFPCGVCTEEEPGDRTLRVLSVSGPGNLAVSSPS